jgi:DNA-binding NarL/FixJ family response regulator
MRTDARLRQTRVLMLTSEDSRSLIERAWAAGVDAFLTKPTSLQALREQLAKLGFA